MNPFMYGESPTKEEYEASLEWVSLDPASESSSEHERHIMTVAAAYGLAAARARLRNEMKSQDEIQKEVQREMAEFAIARWGHLAPWSETGLTWFAFAERIRDSGDPGSEETASAIESIDGRVSDFSIPANYP